MRLWVVVVGGEGVDERRNIQFVSWSDLLGPAYSGSAQVVGGEKGEKAYANGTEFIMAKTRAYRQ